jgi:DNA polymerase elongation subunit (family B)
MKLLYCDIEVTPNLSYHYGTKKIFISSEQIIEPQKVTSVVLMWEFDKKSISFKWDNVKRDDTNLLLEVVPILNKADIIIMQNGDRFDAPTLQNRLCLLKLPPLRNTITFDTLKASKRSFNKAHHSLDARSCEYGLGGKLPREWDQIIAIAKGDKKALEKDIIYNMKDVTDMRSIMYREFNYYNLPQKFLNTLKLFVGELKPYCLKCASRRQSKFKVLPLVVKNSKGIPEKKWECQNCSYKWSRREDLEKNRRGKR